MAKPNITRTYGPMHFEDLEPHRFEDLVRELIYDYKDWQSIEATGRSGNDDGFDIRAYEKISAYQTERDDDQVDEVIDIHPMNGNLWMIQCKRELEIGPQKIKNIISDCINSDAPPYGYILVASANFSKKSFDVFREELKKRGVMEFYLWGKASLEDMLHMPKYDRVLFTFFGISLLTKKRNRSTEIKSLVIIKNRLFKILGEEANPFTKVLIRDINDTSYPYEEDYNDFKDKPRWKIFSFKNYNVYGVWFELHEYYAYYDALRNEYDYTTSIELENLFEDDDSDEVRKTKMDKNSLVREFWEALPRAKQTKVSIWGLVKYEDILVVDEKGDVLNKLLHLYVDFKHSNGPFGRLIHVIENGYNTISVEKEDSKRIKVFPEIIPELKKGKIYKNKSIKISKTTFTSLIKSEMLIKALYDDDDKYGFLDERDIIQVVSDDDPDELFIKITCKYKIKLSKYLEENKETYNLSNLIKDQIGKELNKDKFINVYEFVRTYRSHFEEEN
ncbi:MAG: hypothetical protein JWO92_2446 [Chitinophagaceae bacterium]|nr:hypothetical protein [Chitinophagaceae bacterium]